MDSYLQRKYKLNAAIGKKPENSSQCAKWRKTENILEYISTDRVKPEDIRVDFM
jgi:hypothetical protein